MIHIASFRSTTSTPHHRKSLRDPMPRTIHLAVFSNGARRPAHFSLWVPTGDAGPQGKIIHVTGNIATGFFREFKRNYDFRTTERRYCILPLAQVDAQLVADTPGDGTKTTDTIAHDRIESVAIMVEPPGPNPNPFDPSVRQSTLVPQFNHHH